MFVVNWLLSKKVKHRDPKGNNKLGYRDDKTWYRLKTPPQGTSHQYNNKVYWYL